MLSLDRLLDPAGSYFFSDQVIAVGWAVGHLQQWLYIADGSKATHITIAYTDLPSGKGLQYYVSNNIDLLVCSQYALPCWYSNTFNASTGYSNPYPPTIFHDAVNNVEEVIIPPGYLTTGAPILVWVGFVSVTLPQDFALVVQNAHQ
jgi:hypothetical protein